MPGLPIGLGQVAEFQVRMGVDQARHDGHLAQVFDRHVRRRSADGDDPALGDRHRGVAQGRPGHGKDPAGPQAKWRSAGIGIRDKPRNTRNRRKKKMGIKLKDTMSVSSLRYRGYSICRHGIVTQRIVVPDCSKTSCKTSSGLRASGNQVNQPSRARLATPPNR